MKIFYLTVLLMSAFYCSSAQVEFPVYKPLPIVPTPRVAPTPLPEFGDWRKPTAPRSNQKMQERTIIATFNIETATINGKNYSQMYKDSQACLVIYTELGSDAIFFANYMPSKSISVGPMIDPELIDQPKTSTSYQTQLTKFKWSFSNSYDSEKGVAEVRLLKTYIANGTGFSCTISSKNNFIKFTGQMQVTN